VTEWRHGPVIAGCAAAPYPPPRVLAHEPLKLGILAVPASAGGHRVSQQAAGGRPPGCGRGWARAGVASGLNAAGAAASPARSPGSAALSRPGSRICGTAHGRTGRRRRSCPAEARRARRRAGRSGKTGMLPTETRSRAPALHAPIPPGRSRFTGTARERRASPAPAQTGPPRGRNAARYGKPGIEPASQDDPAASAGEPGFDGADRVSAGTMPASSDNARPSAGDGIRQQLLSWRRPRAAPHRGHYGDIAVSGGAEPVMKSPPAGIAGWPRTPGWPCPGTGGHQFPARGGQLPDSPDRVRCGPAAHRGRRRDRAADVPPARRPARRTTIRQARRQRRSLRRSRAITVPSVSPATRAPLRL